MAREKIALKPMKLKSHLAALSKLLNKSNY